MNHERLKLLRDLNFTSMDQYFEYIIESKINGNHSQVEKLFKQLKKEQRKEFLSYLADQLESNTNGNTVYYELLKYCIELIY